MQSRFNAEQYFSDGGRALVGHTTAAGEPISLEEHKGEIRHRQDSGNSRMAADYGYLDVSRKDHDGMKTDAFVGPHHDSKKVFVVNQQHPHTGKFNEHKVLLGYKDRAHALRDYAHSFSDGLGHKRIQSVVEMGTHELKDWLQKPHTAPLRKAEGGPVDEPRPLTIRRGVTPQSLAEQWTPPEEAIETNYGPRQREIMETYPEKLGAIMGNVPGAVAHSVQDPFELANQAATGQLPPDYFHSDEGISRALNAAGLAQTGGLGGASAQAGETVLGSGAVAKIAPGRKMTLAEVRREFDPYAGANMTPEQIDLLVDAYGRVASPVSEHPDIAAAGRKIADTYITKGGSSGGSNRSYFQQKPSTPLEELGRVAEPIPYTSEPKAIVEKSWEDVGRERAGSPLITLGGDLSDLVRLRGYGPKNDLRALARPTDIHAGFDYMLEPNPNTVWANAPEHAAMLDKQVQEQQAIQKAIDKDLPIMGTAAPMGPRSLDSSKNMMDLYLNALEASPIQKVHLDAVAADMRAGKFGKSPEEKAKLKEKLASFPGFDDIDAARKFLLDNPDVAGTTRAAIIKGLEKSDLVKKGFPEVGQLRVAATSPKFMMAPGNMMGGRMIELDPRMFALAKEGKMFEHMTYPGDTAGAYYGDVPLVQRQYGAPDVADQLAAKYNVWRPGATKNAPPKAPITVHPYSTDQSGRDTWRKMFEEQRMAQPINERMMESIARGEARRSSYGFAEGGAVQSHDPVDLPEQVSNVAHDIARIAHKDRLDQRHLAYLLKIASGTLMPPDRAMEFAGQIMTGDTTGLMQRFQTYVPSARTFARLNEMLGGKHDFMGKGHMGKEMQRMKGVDALQRTKDAIDVAMDSDIVKDRPAMRKALKRLSKRI
jgi:hypothetical protein